LNKKSKKELGFSLIEVLIGLIFLAIGILAIAGLQITSVKGNIFSSNLTQATYVAQDRLEFLKNLSFGDALLNAGNHGDGTTTISGVVFTRTYSIVDDLAGYKKITYTVTWNDGVNHSIAFSTIRSQ
jgi:type II secretory pathway pseudopilin PulG